MAWRVCLSDIDFGREELDRVTEVLNSKWLSMGDVTRQFEDRLAEFLGVRHAFLVANGTAALHLANLAVGVRPGDEVIVPSLTFVATASAAVYCGATAVFADIVGPHDLNLSVRDVEAKIGPKTKAITVLHYGGYVADMEAICRLAREHDLAVIEDAAHAPGAFRNGAMAGAIGAVGCFSFFSNKNLVTGEGGAVVTNDDGIAEEIRLLRSHGMTSLTYERHKGHAFSYDVVRLGYNYRPSEITAALALAQLEKLERNNARRLELTRAYRERLASDDRLILPFADHPGRPSCHLMPILLPAGTNREMLMSLLRERGIQTSVHYPAVHRFTAYRGRRGTGDDSLPRTEEVAARELTLPLHPLMEEADVDLVTSALAEALAEEQRSR
jgi:dTDP-4-amino-4,6-dideoxygalactose transaminase